MPQVRFNSQAIGYRDAPDGNVRRAVGPCAFEPVVVHKAGIEAIMEVVRFAHIQGGASMGMKPRRLNPAQETPPEEIDALVQAADDEYAALTTEGLKERIASLTGARPRGNPSRQTLVQSLRELEGAA